MSLDLVAVMLGAAAALLPVYARDILHAGPAGNGMMRAAISFGSVSVALLLAWRPHIRNVGQRLFLGVVGFGLATIVFALSRNFILSLVALAAMGAADVVSVVIRQSLVQLRTPDEMRGRVVAINSLCISASNQLGDFRAALVAAWLGAVPAVIIGGGSAVVIAILWMAMFPELRRLQRLT